MAYAGKTRAALNRIKLVLDAIAGTQATYKGIPESIAAKVTASVSAGDRDPRDKATQLHETDVNFFIEFAYRVSGNEGGAEDTVADWLDLIEDAWLADRTLAGTVRTSSLDFSLSREPNYRPTAASEFRVYPVVWRTTITR
jgi:hypothetical protein